ncbi:hypothetical protein [Polynucleobacter sp. MWH-Adler-W8]|uniref:hypothetical protein n=1 Tax=Polynucleobacter sp. MWH-Adler-W8 TaxID=1819727 RepID=UPI00092885A4|nr:hypothetical protein [Polynucleobacter sp. MWH-Adler-W8]OJI04673.1 hypothetical protein AOC28_06940 [Polynucleobacter sp. MWH-Adler-W8]
MEIIYLTFSLSIIVYLIFKRPSLLVLNNLIWVGILLIFFIGPIKYRTVGIGFGWLFFLFLFLSAFNLGYFCIYHILSIDGRRENFRGAYRGLALIGFLGVICWNIGGIIYSIDYLLTLNFYDLRLSFVNGDQDIYFLSKIGSLLAGFVFFIFTQHIYEKSKFSAIEIASILLLLTIPFFMAGRQIFLQALLIIIFSLAVKRRFKNKSNISLNGGNIFQDKFISLTIFLAFLAIFLMTLFRAGSIDLTTYQSRLELYGSTSGIELNDNYEAVYSLIPVYAQDILIESTYYFSAQIAKFSEFFNLYDISVIDYGIFEKSLFIKNNIVKIFELFGAGSPFPNRQLELSLGFLPAACWGTVVQTNLMLFGFIGALLVQIIFGGICAISFKSVLNNKYSYYNFNFYIANLIIVFYSILDSVLNEIYFLIYYLISIAFFILTNKFFIKAGKNSNNAI